MSNIIEKLDLKNIPKLIGDEPTKTAKQAYKIIKNTNWPLYLTGPSGSGKTIIAMNLAKKYSKANNVPAYYVQLSPELTKTSLVAGLRLVDGSLKSVNGIIAECMENGGIVIVDEATHSTQELLLVFNSILDRTSITAFGDRTITSKDTFRIIFCSNDSKYSGNVKLPQSFSQRLVAIYCDYPTWEDEVKISEEVAKSECVKGCFVPKPVINYVVSLMREVREEDFPLSVRNVSIALVLLELAQKQKGKIEKLDTYFTDGNNIESMRRNIAKRIFNKESTGIEELSGDEIETFFKYLTIVGIINFKNIILQSFMYFLDVDMGMYNLGTVKEKLLNTII